MNKKEYQEEYQYHLNMVDNPLPYHVWLQKFIRLNQIQTKDGYMENKLSIAEYDLEDDLCRELGY